jgi:hypothetical protein
MTFAMGDDHVWESPISTIAFGALDNRGHYNPDLTRTSLKDTGQHSPEILAAIKATRKLRIALTAKGHEYLSTSFDLSNLAARDALFTQARDKIRAADPKVCTRAPVKVEYHDQPPPRPGHRTYRAECIDADGKTTIKSVILDKPPVHDICG